MSGRHGHLRNVLSGLLTLLVGCVAPGVQRPVALADARCLLFNPVVTATDPTTLTRVDWPSAEAFEHQRETFAYREVILDRQGRFGVDQDQLYRRFDSVRTGRTQR